MDKNYRAIRTRYVLLLYLIIAAGAVSLGLAVGAAVVLISKLTSTAAAVLPGVISGAAVALAAFAVALVPLYPTEKRIARYLDGRLGLSERVGTMVSLAGCEGELCELQRADTEAALAARERTLISPRLLWLLVLPVLAAALLITAIAVPAREEDVPADVGGGEAEESWALTDWHVTALRALIEEVEASAMAQSGKDTVVAELEDLIVRLGYVDTVRTMKATVIESMVKIAAVADGLNSFPELARALVSSPVAYVKAYGEALGSLADPIIESKYHELRAGFTYEAMAGGALSELSSGIVAALATSGIDGADELYGLISAFAASLGELSEAVGTMAEADALAAITAAFDTSAGALSGNLAAQGANLDTATKTNNTLMLIFGIARDELPDELKHSDSAGAGTVGGDYEEKDDEVITDGGKGTGEVIYGSNDAVLDVESDEHVIYGDLLAIYDALKSAELDERELSDAMREFISKYFDDLYYSDENK